MLSIAADWLCRHRSGSQQCWRRLAWGWVTEAGVVQPTRVLLVGVAGRESSQAGGGCSDHFPGCMFSRMISLSREYARRRVAFGKLLKDHPLHMQMIAQMEVRLWGAELNLQ